MSVASSFLTLAEIACAYWPASSQSGRAHSPAENGRARIERVRTTGFWLIERWV